MARVQDPGCWREAGEEHLECKEVRPVPEGGDVRAGIALMLARAAVKAVTVADKGQESDTAKEETASETSERD